MQHFPGLDSYLSEVDRFALDMRKRSTVPTDYRYIDARVAEFVTTALYVAQTTPASSLSRAEVSQATGMLVAQLEVAPAVAPVRLRAHAYATGRSATDVARDILDRRLRLDAD